MALAVHECSTEIEDCRKRWQVLEDLSGGTQSMRAAAQRRLPQWPNEESAAYRARLDTATLFPAWERTLSVMSGKPFSEPLTLNGAPAKIEEWAQDIDQQGTSLHSFAAEMFIEPLGFGLAGILVDYPDTRQRDEQGRPIEGPAPERTVAQVESQGLRPYWVRVKHNQILGWRAQNVGGKMRLTQLRLLETYEEEDGDYGILCQPQVRVLRPGSWEVWRATGSKGAWVLADTGTTSLDVIPFVPLYGKRESFMVGRPPLLELGHLNVKHWQSQSDQDTILHVARVPILYTVGADDNSQLTVGGSSAVKLPTGGEIGYCEHTGASIEAGRVSLQDLEQQMTQSGAELLVKKPGDRSATESANDAEGNKSDLQRIAENFEDSIDQALWLTAQYAGLPDGGTCELFSDYGAATLSDASAQLVLSLQQGGVISKKTTIDELKRRGVLAERVDAEEEAAAVEEDGPPLGMMPDPGAEEDEE